jgi:transposase
VDLRARRSPLRRPRSAGGRLSLLARDRNGEHPERHLAGYGGILQAERYGGYNGLYRSDRLPRPITEAACWAHARRKFFVLADIAAQARDRKKPIVISPIAREAVCKMDDIFTLEREINGLAPDRRPAAPRETIAPRVKDLIDWLRTERARLSGHNNVAKAMNYMLTRIDAFTRFLDGGRICLTNNAAERSLRGIAIGRKAGLFAGSERGGEGAAAMFTLIDTAKLNGVDPKPGFPMCWPESPIIGSPISLRSCLGTGGLTSIPRPPERADQ